MHGKLKLVDSKQMAAPFSAQQAADSRSRAPHVLLTSPHLTIHLHVVLSTRSHSSCIRHLQDLGFDDVGFRSHEIKTPTIDGLVAAGVCTATHVRADCVCVCVCVCVRVLTA